MIKVNSIIYSIIIIIIINNDFQNANPLIFYATMEEYARFHLMLFILIIIILIILIIINLFPKLFYKWYF